MRDFLRTVSFPLIAFLLQTIVVAGLAVAAGRLGRMRPAAYRVAVYRSAVLSIFALLIVGQATRTVVRPWWEIGGISAVSVSSKPNQIAPVSDQFDPVASGNRVNRMGGVAQPRNRAGSALSSDETEGGDTQPTAVLSLSRAETTCNLVCIVLLIGAVLLIGSLVAGVIWVSNLRRSADRPPEDRLRASLDRLSKRYGVVARLSISPTIQSAFVAGAFRPTIYLPRGIEERFSQDQIEAILCHELMHVRQGDCLWALLSRICCSIAWVNPLVWVMVRQLALASEEHCDQLVLAAGVEPAAYAGCLLKVAETIKPPTAERLVGAGVFPAQSHLSKRISLMLNSKSQSLPAVATSSRIKIASVSALAAFGACLLVAASPITRARRDSTPEATVKSLFAAMNAGDWKGVFRRIDGAKVDQAVAMFNKLRGQNVLFPKLTPNLSPTQMTGDTATIQLTIDLGTSGTPGKMTREKDVVTLRQKDGDWLVVTGSLKEGFFDQIIMVSKDPKLMERARTSAHRTTVLSNMKQLALGCIMYAADNKDKFNIGQATLKSAISQYIRNEKVWLGPDGKPLDIRLNPQIIGKSTAEIKDPTQCVLLSIGPKGHLVFADDKTVIAFCDGHVKVVGRDAAATLSWK